MSFIRAATLARSAATSQARRHFATPPAAPKKDSNLAGLLLGTGVAGLAGYVYFTFYGAPKLDPSKSPLDPENFIDFKLKKVEPYNHNTSKFIFELPDGKPSLLPVASCVIVKASDPEALVDKNGKPIIRPYTPISSPYDAGELTFLIKRYDNGNASKHIHTLKAGDTLAIKGPIAKFPYQANEFDQVILIGGGSGITPLYQIATHALSERRNRTKFTLLFSNVTEADILLREELDALKKKHPNTFEVIYALDKPDEKWTGPAGFVNAEMLKKYTSPASLKEKVKVFVCGPPGQVAAIAGKKAGMKQGEIGGVLKELGFTEDQVFKF